MYDNDGLQRVYILKVCLDILNETKLQFKFLNATVKSADQTLSSV